MVAQHLKKKRFESYADFLEWKNELESKQGHSYSCSTRSKGIASAKRPINAQLLYVSKSFSCKRGGKPYKKKSDDNKKPRTMKIDCPAGFDLRATKCGRYLELMNVRMNHTHPSLHDIDKEVELDFAIGGMHYMDKDNGEVAGLPLNSSPSIASTSDVMDLSDSLKHISIEEEEASNDRDITKLFVPEQNMSTKEKEKDLISTDGKDIDEPADEIESQKNGERVQHGTLTADVSKGAIPKIKSQRQSIEMKEKGEKKNLILKLVEYDSSASDETPTFEGEDEIREEKLVNDKTKASASVTPDQSAIVPSQLETNLSVIGEKGREIKTDKKTLLSKIEYPPITRSRGRPTGPPQKAIGGDYNKRRGSVPFGKKSTHEQLELILGPMVSSSQLKQLLSNSYKLKKKDLPKNHLSFPQCLMDDTVQLELLKRYLEPEALKYFNRQVLEKHRLKRYQCPTCEWPAEDGSIFCDSCMCWFHFECVGLKSDPGTAEWFCSSCS